METIFLLFPIIAVLAIGVVSPGPSFILVARTAVAVSRSSAVASALGMATGASVLSIAALFGLQALLNELPLAYFALKVIGGCYLIYLGFKSWRSARQPLNVDLVNNSSQRGHLGHFWLATATMLTNPKAAVQYGGIFAAMLPANPSFLLTAVLPPAVFSLEVSWYLVVSFGLSAPRPRATYLAAKSSIDRTTGAVLGLLGCKFILSTR